MDKPRQSTRKNRQRVYIAAGIGAAVVITVAMLALEPAVPTVEGAAIWTDSVRRGPMVRSVRGVGTLTPEHIRIIPAQAAGRVEQIHLRPGVTVEAGTPLVRLSNPELELQLMESERQLRTAESELLNLRSSLQTQILNQEGVIATVQSQYNEAIRQAKTNEELTARGLIAPNEASRGKDQVVELETRLDIEKKRLALLHSTVETQIGAQQSQVRQLGAIVAHRRGLIDAMDVRAASGGMLSRLDLEAGQWVNPGTELARIVEPGRLKAVLRISDTQMRDVVIGQRAFIDTRNDTIEGTVVRIDPASQGGTIGVDVAFDSDMPASARPDMSVDGVVEIDRLQNVLHVSRPNHGSTGQTIGLWVLSKDGREAERVQVRLGQTSVNFVEIVSGLNQGDVVILSDMQQYDSSDRVRIRN
ncbi:MAG: HlyD family efflux transporter periplasmic adaptor subunit [Gemmatimonadetes bacterium]|nr:HlyD family efflux transporter periplasmic adaptor subunit [Gemmatimonadota bacterium]